jgi:glucose/arabinose dehydrogenase
MKMHKRILEVLMMLFMSLGVTGLGAQTGVQYQRVLSNLDRPWGVAFIDSSSGLITLKNGQVLYFEGGRTKALSGVPQVDNWGQGGMLDVILHKDFAQNKVIFLSFSEPRQGGSSTSVFRAELDIAGSRLVNGQVIVQGNNQANGNGHFGSRLAMDDSGALWITLGDRQERDRAQDLNDEAGTLLRVTEFGQAHPDNPILPGKGAPSRIYSYGHRNAQGMSLHPFTQEVWLHEHGPRGGDEINVPGSGKNYGWPLITHGREYSGREVGEGRTAAPGLEQPLLHWTPSIAPSGMDWYTGKNITSWAFDYTDEDNWVGQLFSGALAGKEIRRVEVEKENGILRINGQESLFKGWSRIRDVQSAHDGSLWFLTDGANGGLYKIIP